MTAPFSATTASNRSRQSQTRVNSKKVRPVTRIRWIPVRRACRSASFTSGSMRSSEARVPSKSQASALKNT